MSGSEYQVSFHPGHEIIGRWDGNRYLVISTLGAGGTACVLLVQRVADGKQLAMKISRDLPGITREHRTHLFLNSNRDIKSLGIVPKVYELDDYCEKGHTYHYIVMDYCRGRGLHELKGCLRQEETINIGIALAVFLHYLHQAGFVFGDIKPGNILYDNFTKKLFVVDFGSVCPKGSVILQYTPMYDRSNWQAGTRCSDEKYDQFALSMLLLSMQRGVSKHLKIGCIKELLRKIKPLSITDPLLPVIIKGLHQEYGLLGEMAAELWQCRGKGKQNISAGSNSIYWAVNVIGGLSAFFFIISLYFYYQ